MSAACENGDLVDVTFCFEALLTAIKGKDIKPGDRPNVCVLEAREAYRHLASQRHFGKVVSQIA